MRGFYRTALPALAVVLLALLIYSNTLESPFQWDEDFTIKDNPIVKDIGYFTHPIKAKGIGLKYYSFRDRYIGYLSFALNYKIHGFDVRGYHLVNIALHIANALLVFLFIKVIFKTPFLEGSSLKYQSEKIAFFSAALFVSHPVQTEAVNYIMGRLPLLMSLFYLSSIVLYIRWRLTAAQQNSSSVVQQGRRKHGATALLLYCASLLSALLAMKTKENAFTLPFMLAMIDAVFFKGGATKRSLYLAPFFIISLVIPVGLIGTDRPFGDLLGGVGEATRHYTATAPRMDYLLTQTRVIVTYIRLLFVPINQNFDYDYPLYRSFVNPEVFLSFVFITLLIGMAVFLLRRSSGRDSEVRLISAGILWFFIALSVESSIFPIPMIISEYRMYLPSFGIFIVLVAGIFMLAEKKHFNTKYVTASLVVITLALSITSYTRNRVWKDNVTMWEDVAEKSPGKARAHSNLGLAYMSKGLTDKAIGQYLLAIKLKPDYAGAYNNLGLAYQEKGDTDTAIIYYKKAVEIEWRFEHALNNLGVAYGMKGLLDEAVPMLERAIKINPYNFSAHINLGTAYYRKGLFDMAIKHYLIASELQPLDPEVHYNLGLSYEEKGLNDEALAEFAKTLRLNPGHGGARKALEGLNSSP